MPIKALEKIALSDRLVKYIFSNEDWLLERIVQYAIKLDYAQYTSTLKEPWRKSIAGLSDSISKSITVDGIDIELKPNDDFKSDSAAAFGIKEATLHRERGVSLQLFMGLMKYYKQSYIDLLHQSSFTREDKEILGNYLNRFFDRVEIALYISWTDYDESNKFIELQNKNKETTNEKNKYLTIFESLGRPYFLVDSSGKIENYNYAAGKFLGLKKVPGENYYSDNSQFLLLEEIPWIRESYEAFLKSHKIKDLYEVKINEPSQYFSVSFAKSLDISDKFQSIIVAVEDITNRKLLEQQLEDLSTKDPLTGAKNRRYFNDVLELEISHFKRYKTPFAILLLDIDNFKEINDQYGHDVGDDVLRNLVRESSMILRDSDVFARWGGEEFIALLPKTNSMEAYSVAERVREKLSLNDIFTSNGQVINYTVSIGLKVQVEDATLVGLDQIIKDADLSLYSAKEGGKNKVVLSN